MQMVAQDKLSGSVIGTAQCVDYSTNSLSYTVNIAANAFDSNYESFFAAYPRSGGWVGLDLGEKHIITTIAYAPRKYFANRMLLGVFEGANNPDFGDAVPLCLVAELPQQGNMTEQTVNCSRAFRYVRYVGPNDVRCNISELAFYGVKGNGDNSHLSQLTNLPTVTIHTKEAQDIVEKEMYLDGIVSIISNNETSLFSNSLHIKGRGNASWNFAKKPYRMKLYNSSHLLDFPAKAKNWTLINNYEDKTLFRNLLAFDLSRRLGMPYTPCRTFG